MIYMWIYLVSLNIFTVRTQYRISLLSVCCRNDVTQTVITAHRRSLQLNIVTIFGYLCCLARQKRYCVTAHDRPSSRIYSLSLIIFTVWPDSSDSADNPRHSAVCACRVLSSCCLHAKLAQLVGFIINIIHAIELQFKPIILLSIYYKMFYICILIPIIK